MTRERCGLPEYSTRGDDSWPAVCARRMRWISISMRLLVSTSAIEIVGVRHRPRGCLGRWLCLRGRWKQFCGAGNLNKVLRYALLRQGVKPPHLFGNAAWRSHSGTGHRSLQACHSTAQRIVAQGDAVSSPHLSYERRCVVCVLTGLSLQHTRPITAHLASASSFISKTLARFLSRPPKINYPPLQGTRAACRDAPPHVVLAPAPTSAHLPAPASHSPAAGDGRQNAALTLA